MRLWTNKFGQIRTDEEAAKVKLAVFSADNHYVGFGPGTANIFRKNDWTRRS